MNNTMENVTKAVSTMVNNEESLKEFGIGYGLGGLTVIILVKGLPKIKETGGKLINKVFKKKDKVEEIVEETVEVVEEIVEE